jgi:hypothetical protein
LDAMLDVIGTLAVADEYDAGHCRLWFLHLTSRAGNRRSPIPATAKVRRILPCRRHGLAMFLAIATGRSLEAKGLGSLI